MRTLIVTSALTFVPENYDRMICGMASDASVVGLLVLENRKSSFLIKAAALILSLSAPRMGWTLIKNYFGSSMSRRKKTYESIGKKIWVLPDINTPEALQLIQSEKIDLVINSRTRSIFKKSILEAPRLGCVNIHHGLLPEQRGLMCDFWAHLEDQDFGFSIHQMTPKIDDGPILKVVPVKSSRKNYLESLLAASEKEAQVCRELIVSIQQSDSLEGLKNQSQKVRYRKNPSLKDAYRLQLKGIKI